MESVTSDQPVANSAPDESTGDCTLASTRRDSAALRRLMEEVRCDDVKVSSAATAYNRQHNRHNR